VAEAHPIVAPDAFIIGTAVAQGIEHPRHRIARRLGR
jgi:hypothetical protein